MLLGEYPITLKTLLNSNQSNIMMISKGDFKIRTIYWRRHSLNLSININQAVNRPPLLPQINISVPRLSARITDGV